MSEYYILHIATGSPIYTDIDEYPEIGISAYLTENAVGTDIHELKIATFSTKREAKFYLSHRTVLQNLHEDIKNNLEVVLEDLTKKQLSDLKKEFEIIEK